MYIGVGAGVAFGAGFAVAAAGRIVAGRTVRTGAAVRGTGVAAGVGRDVADGVGAEVVTVGASFTTVVAECLHAPAKQSATMANTRRPFTFGIRPARSNGLRRYRSSRFSRPTVTPGRDATLFTASRTPGM